jgi:hypothetical protein
MAFFGGGDVAQPGSPFSQPFFAGKENEVRSHGAGRALFVPIDDPDTEPSVAGATIPGDGAIPGQGSAAARRR